MLEFRPVQDTELDGYVSMLELAAGRRAGAEALAEARATYDLERTLAAFERGRPIGGLASDPLELTVPGGVIPAARVTLTGVLPTHRRRGVSTELNRRQLRWLRERGEPVAVFMTSGPRFYRRVGYSPATLAVEAEVPTGRHLLATGSGEPGAMRVVDEPERDRMLPEVFDRHRRLQPGQMSRPAPFWAAWFRDLERYRKGEPGDRFAAVCEDASGAAQGYVTYRLRPGTPRDDPVATFVVEDLVAVTHEARRSLWDYCLGFEQAERVLAHNLPADEPLAWMLHDPRLLRVTRVRDFLWLRLVDLERALAARAYGSSGSLAVEVADPTLPENAGRFLLETDGSGSSVSRTALDPELSVDVADLAAVYLGGTTFRTLARAGRIRAAADVLDRADTLFGSRPAPWTVSDW